MELQDYGMAIVYETPWDPFVPYWENPFIRAGLVLVAGGIVFVVLRTVRFRKMTRKMRDLEQKMESHLEPNNEGHVADQGKRDS